MTKLSEVSYEDFNNLVNFLRQRETSKNKEVLEFAISKDLEHFIPNITAESSIALNTLLHENNTKEAYDDFLINYPNLEFDATGKSKPKIDYNQLVVESLDMMYANAKERFDKGYYSYLSNDPTNNETARLQYKIDKQIVEAFSLKPLINMETETKQSYTMTAIMTVYNKNYDGILLITKNQYSQLQSDCNNILHHENNIAPKVLAYSMKKKPDNVKVFINHIIERVHLVYEAPELCKWKNEFIKNLKQVK